MGQTTTDFLGTERFRIRRRVGSGGMGVVYEAHDRETDKVVALKALTRTEASHISRFKNEFRSLADVAHPNLVSLYEFMSDGQYWFFTMELVHGLNFLEYVRPGYRAKQSTTSKTPTLLKSPTDSPSAAADYEAETQHLENAQVSSPETSGGESVDLSLSESKLDLDRLNDALRQLVEGLQALHEMGKLHRDIKPSNVLVTKEGRVVILDFGLVAEVEGKGLHESINLAGTPDYMSPEQGAQSPISRASDWYSVGVILFQALTGRLPFSGKFFQVMMNKQSMDPPAPAELAPDVPESLNLLCKKLLRRNPELRPSGHEILRVLGPGRTSLKSPVITSTSSPEHTAPFVGRQLDLEKLRDAFAATCRGSCVTTYIHGRSGMGKTALVRHFLQNLRADKTEPVVLEGRVYERESVPYKAIDGVVDSLTKYLMHLPEGKAEALMPRDALALARLFPVMLQVECVSSAPQREQEIPDPFELRRRAFAALRELFGRISDRQPLVVYIDDLQWSDADSIILLEELLRSPDAPPLLLLSSFRTEDLENRTFLKTLLEKTGTDVCRQLTVAPLTTEDARYLVRELLESDDPATASFVESIVREARGNPFLIEQLARYALTSDHSATTGITLNVMLDARLKQLPKGARQFVDTLAVAGRPINPEVAFQAAGLSGDELPLVGGLRASQFLRSGGSDHTVELYHDRIRETLAVQLDQARVKQIHRRLARAIEVRGIDDPEALFEHYLGAGERVRASTHAAIAARKAATALAFDRAAALYRRALELAPAGGVELFDLKLQLAEALVNAGRPAEAAQAYLDLARNTSTARSLDFQRRAAEQLLMGGHIKEGLELIKAVLAAAGFSFPGGPRLALLSLVLKRLQIRFRGLNFIERDVSQIPSADLFRIDLCWAIAAGLGAVDLVRGADFHCRHLLLALRAGEPFRIAKAMAFEIAQSVSPGGRSEERGMQLTQQAEALALKVGHPHAIALAVWANGIAAYLLGRWKKAAELCERASEILRDQCTGVAWELAMARRFMLSSLLYMGEVGEVARRVPILLATALDQGNVFAATDLRTRLNLIWLAADDPDRGRAEVMEALKAWPHEGFHLQHYSAMLAFAQIELYTGDAEVAWKHIQGQWKLLRGSMLLQNQVLRIEATHLLGRAALGSARDAVDSEKRLKLVDKMAQKITKERMLWANPLANLLRAGVASFRNDNARATTLLNKAVEEFEQADMHLYAAAARRRLGEVVGGERGRQLVAEADAWMTKQQIKNPQAMTRMLAPGFGSAAA
ncbi:MAG TPA: protein kinase [Pyrinomonadaceae bacterium]|nr:protein kinase [Pyrinomonadaceae bacterium]